MTSLTLFLLIILSPLVTSTIVGLFGFALGKKFSHYITITGMLIATVCSYLVLYQVYHNGLYYNGPLYTWLQVGDFNISVGLLIDSLTSVMLVVVSSVSLMVHIYTIGYMAHEDGYQRFFSYISLFTFMMYVLVASNNFAQLFFGWEGVGLVSYLLIGFYYKKETAIFANLKAFLINRIGDFGFILGIGLIFAYFNTLNYVEVFKLIPTLIHTNFELFNCNLITLICILLFVGAMGKSAQFPLHVWLPDSMEGPTPISALIHAATMVTAGIFMVARLSPLYNQSSIALSVIIVVGGINCLFLGILGIIQNDIKRVVAYSTLSQLGYMAVALGCGAYSVAIFHLVTHAFFKGLLFLAAGSVIVAMHHEQDMTKMGGLAKYLPITYITMLIGSLSLAGIPPFSGFFSKDMVIDAAVLAYKSGLPGSSFAVFTVYASVLVTAIYSFRLIFMTFHGTERFDSSHHKPHESPLSITLPLILMAVPSIILGWLAFKFFINNTLFVNSIFNGYDYVNDIQNKALDQISLTLEAFKSIPVYLGLSGILIAWFAHKNPNLIKKFVQIINPIFRLLQKNYFMDDLYIKLLAPFGRFLGNLFWNLGDIFIIDGIFVNGSAKLIKIYSVVCKRLQSGYINVYASFMIFGLIMLITFYTKLIFS